ncbi:MAG: hypothetical protein ISN29_02585 [Gammaproteobacteria bacterium AqS3]|nr:hypothetical protein [Gammaproteobacteria bacterium AqS3]
MKFIPPSTMSYVIIDNQSIRLFWFPVEGAISYDLRVGASDTILSTDQTNFLCKGLLPILEYRISIRSVFPHGYKSEWSHTNVQTSFGTPPSTTGKYDVLSPIPDYNNILTFDLIDYGGYLQSCTLRLIWHPSDEGWWADLEVPTGTPAILGRRMGLNCGILDDCGGVLAGNIVMRAAAPGVLTEPDSECFRNKTHELRWEPLS